MRFIKSSKAKRPRDARIDVPGVYSLYAPCSGLKDMDMDWDQIATLAQLVTGVATLAVAVLLAESVTSAASGFGTRNSVCITHDD